MSTTNSDNFSFQEQFIISDVLHELDISSVRGKEDERMVERTVCTLRAGQKAVTIIRTWVEGEPPEISSTGEGFEEGPRVEKLKEFVSMWFRVVVVEAGYGVEGVEGCFRVLE